MQNTNDIPETSISGEAAIVAEFGSYQIKAGFSGDEWDETSNYSILQPIHEELASGEDPMESNQIWQNIFTKLLVDPKGHPIFLVEKQLASSIKREIVAQLLFENFNVPAIQGANEAILTLAATGRIEGLVIQSGENSSSVVPIVEGRILDQAVHRINVGGRLLTNWYTKFVCNIENEVEKQRIARDIKEKHAYVSLNPSLEDKEYQTTPINDVEYILPDATTIVLKEERFKGPELLFQDGGFDAPGIGQIAYQSIQASLVDYRWMLYHNIVVSGGNTMLFGYPERIDLELYKVVPPRIEPIKIIAPPDRRHLAWLGGSILTSLTTFKDNWISQREYNECGASVVHRQCK